MTRIQLNREQWWLLGATYAAVLFVQRDHLQEPNTATVFLIVGALLLMWRLNSGQTGPAEISARRPVFAIVCVVAGLSLGALILNNWPSSQGGAATSSAAFQAPAAPQAVAEPPSVRALSPAPDGQAPISPADLLQAFQTNDYLADQKYHDRFVHVAGEVASVGGDRYEVPSVQLSLRPKRLDAMPALFPKNAAQIKGLKEGDRITVSCSLQYDADVDNVTLNDCSLVK